MAVLGRVQGRLLTMAMVRDLREDALAIFRAGLEAVKPERLLEREFREEDDGWRLGEEAVFPFPDPEDACASSEPGKPRPI